MTLVELLNKANKGYPDGFLSTYYDEKTGKPIEGASGDTLAEFVVREISETYSEGISDEDQMDEALRVIERARTDLLEVAKMLDYNY